MTDPTIVDDPTARPSALARWVTVVATLVVIGVAADRLRAHLPGVSLSGTTASAAMSGPRVGPEFWDHWGDGKAELDAYRLTQPRYGEARSGTVVHVFVTEPFSRSDKVKVRPGARPEADVVQVLKLNEMRAFQTGIYDYDTMTSVFTPLSGDGAGQPLKLAFSSQEWCGMLYEELRVQRRRIDQHRFSYFDGESRPSATLPKREGGLFVDQLPVALRGLVGEARVEPGETRELPVLPSLLRARLLHRELGWTRGTLHRAAAPADVTVEAGRFSVDTYTLTLETGDRYVYRLETAYPHRVVSWEGPDGESAELLGSTRLAYWELNHEGAERYLEQLGLR